MGPLALPGREPGPARAGARSPDAARQRHGRRLGSGALCARAGRVGRHAGARGARSHHAGQPYGRGTLAGRLGGRAADGVRARRPGVHHHQEHDCARPPLVVLPPRAPCRPTSGREGTDDRDQAAAARARVPVGPYEHVGRARDGAHHPGGGPAPTPLGGCGRLGDGGAHRVLAGLHRRSLAARRAGRHRHRPRGRRHRGPAVAGAGRPAAMGSARWRGRDRQ